jgi:uncharacterized lipoprotein YddW (UPF0748 family)
MRALVRAALSLAAAVVVVGAPPASAQPAHYRAFWVDTFNTTLNNHDDVLRVVDNATAARANAVFVQVRRRGDSWYLDTLEPLADRTPIAAGFDPLRDMIEEAHARGIEVHAFVIVGALWNRIPPNHPPAGHVFNRHGLDPASTDPAGTFHPGRENWITRTLLADSPPPPATQLISFQGHRIGNDFWMEPGHPDAARYTVEVLTHLVRNYDIDGLHLDRIRYPELSVSGQTPITGTNIGYNETNVQRFRNRYGLLPGSVPAQNDPAWSQWRRDQVTHLVRRIYLESVAVKPQLKVSASLIAFGGGPTTEAAWNSAEAYWRVYQDWNAWTREGILDIAVPMAYKREHSTGEANQYVQWNEWAKNHAYDRFVLIGQGSFLNGVEGTLRQVRRALAPSAAGHFASGIAFFSMANSDRALNAAMGVDSTNPFAIPPGKTLRRSFAEFASGLTTGKSVDGTVLYETEPVPVFALPAAVPDMPWKSRPQVGHLKGLVTDEAGAPVDAGALTLARLDDLTTPTAGRTAVTGATDGNGFYGGVDLAPGTFEVTVTSPGAEPWTAACRADVIAGQVATLDLAIDRHAPTLTLTVDPSRLWPPNHKPVQVTIAGAAMDTGTGIESVRIQVTDEYGVVQPAVAPVPGNGAATLEFSVGVALEASRDGQDRDGRVYTIEATVTDRACQQATATAQVLVPHDSGRHGGGKKGAAVID